MDQLDRLLSGDIDTWVSLAGMPDLGELHVKVDAALSEARMHAMAYRQILAELRQGAKPGKPASALAATTGVGGGGGIADLSARIAERRNQAAR